MNVLITDLDHVLQHTGNLWEELRGQRIFITGGTGFFGCWFLESFAWANEKLKLDATATILTRNPAAFQKKVPNLAASPSVRFHTGDIRSFSFPEGHFSYVIHAATSASTGFNEGDPLEMLDAIVGGTRRILDFALVCRAKKFLLTSSGAAYGRQPSDLTHVPEEHTGGPDPMEPSSSYGEGKRIAELLCAIYHKSHGLQTKIARCFAFVGPYLPLDAHFAIGNFIRDTLNGGPICVKGDGAPYRSYLYAADLAIWLWTILFRGISNRPYNVGSENALTVECLARLVADLGKKNMPVSIAQKPVPSISPQRYVPSTRRARAELGLQEHISLEDAIQRTIRFHEKPCGKPQWTSGPQGKT